MEDVLVAPESLHPDKLLKELQHLRSNQVELEVDECSPVDYLDIFIFPVLLPGLDALIRQAIEEKCFERKRTKFNGLDFLTEWLYRNNPRRTNHEDISLESIPFVRSWLKDHPRPTIPLSLIWSEEKAATVIQSYWRGFLVRKEPEVQELRQYQREMRGTSGISIQISDSILQMFKKSA
ncbi:PREDICTED: IQ domain-containing protein K-like isoform X1 [Priapulus caudatus]|uniref:IQ domain-containing protein K-like isoform X1 n=1 Tax=Priapulus caudatus TaxID=37621 RepID=A0ABM1EFR7_PRICU|nr:PREDICTED: IQ domain-containing protein K-like isoform X1 [Priapulus caudatus]